MNLLLFKDEELREGNRLVVRGERAEHLRGVLKSEPGDSIRVGKIGGGIGKAQIVEANEESIILVVDKCDREAPEPNIDLVLALPRPQMLKRILENIPSLGVRRLFLIRSSRVERSFFSSPVLRPENIEKHLRIGMEQAVVTRQPEVQIFDRFKPFVEDVLPVLMAASARLLLHNEGGVNLLGAGQQQPKFLNNFGRHGFGAGRFFSQVETVPGTFLVAIGPEGGWVPHEVELLKGSGLHVISLGQRVLRVETAVYAALANIQMLYEFSAELIEPDRAK